MFYQPQNNRPGRRASPDVCAASATKRTVIGFLASAWTMVWGRNERRGFARDGDEGWDSARHGQARYHFPMYRSIAPITQSNRHC
jgi:hypothetical protein